MKVSLNIKDVEHHVSKAPLTDHKVDPLIVYLKASNLKAKDTVFLDLTCNFAPGPHKNTRDKSPQFSGRANVKKFHLIDSEGHKLVVPSGDSVDTLIKRIARVTGSVTTKDVLVVKVHHYQGIMGRFGPLNRPNHDDVVISHMDCVGPRAFLDLLILDHLAYPTEEPMRPATWRCGFASAWPLLLVIPRKRTEVIWRNHPR